MVRVAGSIAGVKGIAMQWRVHPTGLLRFDAFGGDHRIARQLRAQRDELCLALERRDGGVCRRDVGAGINEARGVEPRPRLLVDAESVRQLTANQDSVVAQLLYSVRS